MATAIEDYQNAENGEFTFLSLKRGDLIEVLQKDDFWWFGQNKKDTGWFPPDKVQLNENKDGVAAAAVLPSLVLTRNDSSSQKANKSNSKFSTSRAFFSNNNTQSGNFNSHSSYLHKQTSFSKQNIKSNGLILPSLDEHQYEEIGPNFSPNNLQHHSFVSNLTPTTKFPNTNGILEPLQAEADQVIAISSYESERDDDIDIEGCDIITVLERRFPKWWKGRNERTGKIGLFPSKIVKTYNRDNNNSSNDNNNIKNGLQNDQNQNEIVKSKLQKLAIGKVIVPVLPKPVNFLHNERQQRQIVRTDTLKIRAKKSAQIGLERMISTESLYSQTKDIVQYATISEHSALEEENDFYYDSFDSDSDNDQNNEDSDSVSLRSSQMFTIRVMDSNVQNNKDTKNRSSQQRFFVICELIETEQKYTEQLCFTLQNFTDSIQKSRLMAIDEINTILGHLRRIYEINNAFYEELKAQNESSTENIIGATLTKYLEQMLPIYQSYCSSNIAELSSKIDENQQFGCELEEISAQNNSIQTFKTGLLRPMQRITKYPLLIEKLLKNTSTEHPDRPDCQRALDCSKLLCKEIDKIYDETCLQWEPFRKLLWIQKHILIPSDKVDHTIDFNSETQFLGPRILIHSGMLFSNNKLLFAFLFNDFFLLAKPNKQPRSITEGIDLFNNVDTRSLKCTLQEKPILLFDLQVADLNEFESSLNSNLFRIEIKSLKKHISFRANSVDEWVEWVEQINRAKANYNRTEHLFRNIDSAPIRQPDQNPIAIFTLASVEAFQLYSRNYALNAYCKVAMGRDWSQKHSITISATVRRVMDFRKATNELTSQHKTFFSKLKSGTRRSFAFGSSIDTAEDPHRLIWEMNSSLKVFNSDDTLFIRCYDANPFAPHQFLGEARLSIREIIQQNRYTNKGISTKGVNLDMPNEQLSKNFLFKLNIKPCLLVRFDWAINTDVNSIRRLYNFQESNV